MRTEYESGLEYLFGLRDFPDIPKMYRFVLL